MPAIINTITTNYLEPAKTVLPSVLDMSAEDRHVYLDRVMHMNRPMYDHLLLQLADQSPDKFNEYIVRQNRPYPYDFKGNRYPAYFSRIVSPSYNRVVDLED